MHCPDIAIKTTATPPVSPMSDYAGFADAAWRRAGEIDAWFAKRFGDTAPFFYNSVDVRRAGFKIAPVDTNLFPGGFNNLSEGGRKRAAAAAACYMSKYYPKVRRLLILAESHTRNRYYLENVRVLQEIVSASGVEARVATLHSCETGEAADEETESGETLHVDAFMEKDGRAVSADGNFIADAVLLNNDLSGGVPEWVERLLVPVFPSPQYGWHRRRKSSHFDAYNAAARELCAAIDVDSWAISPLHRKCGAVDFSSPDGVACIARNADALLHRIQKKYDEYGIKDEPFVFIKADSGTYGMGMMTATSGEEIFGLSRKARKKMTSIKEGRANDEVIIQEGVPSLDLEGDAAAEPMVYLIGGTPVGAMLRYNPRKNARENLNASGMMFKREAADDPLWPATACVARLASYASAWECYNENYAI